MHFPGLYILRQLNHRLLLPQIQQWILVKIFFTKIDYFTTLVRTASGTEPMRQFWFTTFRACGNGGCGQSVMGTTNSGTGMRVSSFR